jgi:hypothetical protein
MEYVRYKEKKDRLWKRTVDIVTQNQQTVQSEVLRDRGRTVEDSGVHIDTEPEDGKVWGIDQQWTDCGGQRWT